MIKSILTRNDVKTFLDCIITKENINDKVIPNTISGEKINSKEYILYICLDAIMKFAIIVNDDDLLEGYLERVKRILRKVDSHNEICSGINKLIIKMCSKKLNVQDFTEYENKKKIVEYIYDKYIVNGYFYHSFPSIFKNDVLENGLHSNNYYHSIEEVKKINQIFNKYKIENVFSKQLDKDGYLSITDSFFMACFYSNNSPLYLQELCENIYNGSSKKFKKDAYLLKKYNECISNIEFIIKKKEISAKDRDIILKFFHDEWKTLSISNSYPIITFIKRSSLKKNSLSNYHEIINKLDSTDIYTSVSKILEVKYNEEKIIGEVKKEDFFLKKIPSVSSYYKNSLDEVIDDISYSTNKREMDEYGNATIVALFGVFLISMGITLMIIMMGQ